MRTSGFVAGAAVLATTAYAQVSSDLLQVVSRLSPGCQGAIFSLTTSPAVECLNVAETVSIVSEFLSTNANSSIVPTVDRLLSVDCSAAGCSNATISQAASQIVQGCASDLRQYNIQPGWISTIAQHYPLAREVVCLRTNDTSSIANATLAQSNGTIANISSDNGTVFCATSLLTTLADVVDANLTIPFFIGLYESYQNNTLQQYAEYFNASDICEECIFAAADVVGVVYPGIGNITLASLGFSSNNTQQGAQSPLYNTTLAAALNSTCSADGLAWTSNGTLPESISLGAGNSTFGFTLITSNETFTPSTPAEPIGIVSSNTSSTSSATGAQPTPSFVGSVASSLSSTVLQQPSPSAAGPGRRNIADVKARWVGRL